MRISGVALAPQDRSWSARWRLPAGVAISFLCLALALHHVQPQRVLAAFASVSLPWLLAGIVAVAPAFIATAVRWRVLLRPAGAVSSRRAGRLLAIAYLLNLVFPARPGDILRAYLVGRPSGPPIGAALTTIVIEKALDGAAVVTLVAVLLAQLPEPDWVRHGILAAGVIFPSLLIAMAVLSFTGGQLGRTLTRLVRRRPALQRRVTSAVAQIQSGARSFAEPRSLAAVLLLTVAVWSASLLTAYALAAAFSLQIPAAAPALALGVATLGLVVPAAPGGIGPYQVLVMAVLTPAGVPAATAFSYGLALQFCQILPLAALGALAGAAEWRDTPISPRPAPSADEQRDVAAPEGAVVQQF